MKKKNCVLCFWILTFFVLLCSKSYSQSLVINELMPSNSVTIHDEDGDYSDWVELFNPLNENVDLLGYGLSDDPSNPFKWIFPSVNLAPSDYLLVFASDKNRTKYIKHWQAVISWGDIWKYRLGTSEPPTNWKNLGFNDFSWSSGPSGFGYGDGDDSTLIPSSVHTVYIRKTFSVEDINTVETAVLHVDYDDAFVAYLNGVEIARANIGTVNVPPAFNDFATTFVEPVIAYGGKPEPILISNIKSLLQNGENVLAIQVHNSSTGSSDLTLIPFLSFGMSAIPTSPRTVNPIILLPNKYLHTNFKLSADGESLVLTNPQGNVIDQINFPSMISDVSFGRKPDGAQHWFYFEEPTPAKVNSLNGFKGITAKPTVSHTGGKYNSPITVTISGGSTSDSIYFTLDGSEPNSLSLKYHTPIQVNSTTVLRARAFSQDLLPSKTATNTYLINFNTQLPVVSLSTNPENFFDEETGIYTMGDSAEASFPYFGANFWKEWERPVHIELFEADGSSFKMDAGVQIFGGWTRGHPQKSLAIFARGRYGFNAINYKLFDDLPFTEYQAFVLRNSGNDWVSTMFRDGLMTGLLNDIDVEHQAFKPAIVFINGAYWGIHNIREKVNEHFLAQHHNVNPDILDILELDGRVIQGNNEDYISLYSFIENNNLNDSANYKYVESKIDLNNFIKYFVSQIYFANTDWPGSNIKYWRNNENGKWRWILFDTDFGFGLFDANAFKHNTLAFATDTNGPNWPNPPWSTLFLRKLLENSSFKNDFINCFADFSNSIFKATLVNEKINLHKLKIESEIPRHAQRWNQFDYNGWLNNIQSLRNFANQRLTYMQLYFVQRFSLAGLAPVKITLNDTSMGSILLNSINIKVPTWTGSYFLGVPIQCIAKPKTGYKFLRWEDSLSSIEDTITISLSSALNLKAVFGIDTNFTLPKIVINEINYNSSLSFNTEDWIELYNNSDQSVDLSNWKFKDSDDSHIFTIPPGTSLNPTDYLILCTDTSLFKPLFPNTSNYIGNLGFGLSGSGELIRLYDSQMNIIDSLVYDDAFPWPTAPDGNGPTLSLKNPNLDNSRGENWAASLGNGTPGYINDVLTNINGSKNLPYQYSLKQNYPNPFNAKTIINYSVPNPAHVSINIYDLLGSQVAQLVNNYQTAGNYSILFDAENLPSGVYFCNMQSGDFFANKKLVLLK